MLPLRSAARRLCTWKVPAHLGRYTPFYTEMPGRCMIIGQPFWKYQIAVVPPPPEMVPLINAVRELESTTRPVITAVSPTPEFTSSCAHTYCDRIVVRHSFAS